MLSPENLCEELGKGLSTLFQCSPAPQKGIRVRTPFMYPDGGIVDVFVDRDAHGYLVTDFGDALGWLRNQTIKGSLTPRQRRLIDDVVLTLDVEFHKGQITQRCEAPEKLAQEVQRIGQAALRVADVWFTFQTRAFETVADEVDEWLTEKEISYEKRFRSEGRSGRTWTVDYKTSTQMQTSLVFLLSTGSRGATNRITERVHTGCIDLKNSKPDISDYEFVSLFDDTIDIWRPHDFNLLEGVSRVGLWSDRDALEDILKYRV